jgi:ankyrin repeat protein
MGMSLQLVDLQGRWTPLHAAAQEGHQDMAALLLDRGAKVDTSNEVSMAVHLIHCLSSTVQGFARRAKGLSRDVALIRKAATASSVTIACQPAASACITTLVLAGRLHTTP